MNAVQMTPAQLTGQEYRALAAFRYQLRCFLAVSDNAARAFGLRPAQHQLMLALAALSEGAIPTVGALARHLLIRHHSVVGLLDRLEERGLVARERGTRDRRQVRVSLTPAGRKFLMQLSSHHRAELRDGGPALVRALGELLAEGPQDL